MTRRKPETNSRMPAGYLRRSIAAAAARLMADDGIADYGAAKRKAARQLGAGDHETLPSNEEVEVELRSYQALFQDEEQREHLQVLRAAAMEVMQLLADFRPCLTGQVLAGTAGRYSCVELDLFADSSKDVEIFLLSREISYGIDDLPRRGHDAAETRLRLAWDDIDVQLMIYPITAERVTPRHPNGARARQRARLPAVVELVESKQ